MIKAAAQCSTAEWTGLAWKNLCMEWLPFLYGDPPGPTLPKNMWISLEYITTANWSKRVCTRSKFSGNIWQLHIKNAEPVGLFGIIRPFKYCMINLNPESILFWVKILTGKYKLHDAVHIKNKKQKTHAKNNHAFVSQVLQDRPVNGVITPIKGLIYPTCI